jgi:ribosomal protein S18 acetylase RimI-like enzyme
MSAFAIEPLRASPNIRTMLSEILIQTVAAGGSVTFMHPLAPETAAAFWDDALTAAERGERILLGAFEDGGLISTVSLLLDCPQNQPHRAEIAKMMTRPSWRGRGAGSALLREAERLAIARGRTLLTLDTAEDEGASGFYQKLGYTLAGTIPDYAFKPHGGLTGAMFYWKRIGAAAT